MIITSYKWDYNLGVGMYKISYGSSVFETKQEAIHEFRAVILLFYNIQEITMKNTWL
jgi:hypothetical protein